VSQAYDVLYRSGGSTTVTDYCRGWDGDETLRAFAPDWESPCPVPLALFSASKARFIELRALAQHAHPALSDPEPLLSV
jgi:hypothetical protein